MILKRKSFSQYIWECYFKFLRKEGRYAYTKEKDFDAYLTLNRNPDQVPPLLWKKLLENHLKNHINN